MGQDRSHYEKPRDPGPEDAPPVRGDAEDLARVYLSRAGGNPSLALRMLAAELLDERPDWSIKPGGPSRRVAKLAVGLRA